MRPPRVDADPSEEPQPGKAKSEYRNYTEGKLLDRVYTTYLLMHTHQTVDFVRRKSAEYGGCSLRRMSVMEALELLDQLVDESDPDVDFPNSFHAYQTAEGIRRAHPDKVGRGGGHLPRGLQGAEVRGLQRLHLPREPRQQGPPVQHGVRDVPAPLRPGERAHVLGTRRVHVQGHEVQQLRPAQGGLLHGSLPLLLPVARARGLRAPLQRGGPAHAALGQGAQQVRPLHQAGGAARCAGAAGLLPVPHRQVLPGAALLVSWDPPTRSPSPPGTQHCTRPPCLPRTLPRGTRPSINLLGTHRGAGRSQGTGLGRARWGGCSRTKWDQHSPHFSPWPPQPFWCEGEARGWNVKGFI
ncbi:inositol oxygenase isoform X2 [Anser cygnoides]|uniref:inositol oxygenase isoform X2 n=1 Tax=Anser cygnoides TaxID=8845 RepID=UPI0034D29405